MTIIYARICNHLNPSLEAVRPAPGRTVERASAEPCLSDDTLYSSGRLVMQSKHQFAEGTQPRKLPENPTPAC